MEAVAAKLLVGPVCAGVGLALQVVHSSTDGFSAGVAVRPRVQFDVFGEYEEEGDDVRKGVPPKRKNGNGSSSPRLVRRAEPVGCMPERLHLFPRAESTYRVVNGSGGC